MASSSSLVFAKVLPQTELSNDKLDNFLKDCGYTCKQQTFFRHLYEALSFIHVARKLQSESIDQHAELAEVLKQFKNRQKKMIPRSELLDVIKKHGEMEGKLHLAYNATIHAGNQLNNTQVDFHRSAKKDADLSHISTQTDMYHSLTKVTEGNDREEFRFLFEDAMGEEMVDEPVLLDDSGSMLTVLNALD